ncbi:MAG: hypothetical protein PVH21_04455 [Myxococcales bacterium]
MISFVQGRGVPPKGRQPGPAPLHKGDREDKVSFMGTRTLARTLSLTRPLPLPLPLSLPLTLALALALSLSLSLTLTRLL